LPIQEGPARISGLFSLFGIDDVADEFIEGYSQGMKQRLLFASALVHMPKVLVIDEPFVGLDPFGIRLAKGIIGDVCSRGTAILLATHNLSHAGELCHRLGFIRRGTLVAVRTREEIHGSADSIEELFMKLSGPGG